MSNNALLRVTDARIAYNTRGGDPVEAVSGVSFSVSKEQLLCLVGPSGCGKSSLLHAIGGLRQLSSGTIEMDGTAITQPHPSIAYMTQRDTLLPWATALENVRLPIRAVKRRDLDLAYDLLELVNLRECADQYPHELSGGMRKRIQFARALAQKPKILLMDEPFGALDVQTKQLVSAEFLRLWEAERLAVVFVTHDLAEAVNIASDVVIMSRGPGRVKDVFAVTLPRPRVANGVLTEPEYQRMYAGMAQSLAEEL